MMAFDSDCAQTRQRARPRFTRRNTSKSRPTPLKPLSNGQQPADRFTDSIAAEAVKATDGITRESDQQRQGRLNSRLTCSANAGQDMGALPAFSPSLTRDDRGRSSALPIAPIK